MTRVKNQRCPFLRGKMVPRVSRRSPLSMKSYVQYIARDVRWYIIVKPHVSYDGGVPVGGHAKVASRNEDLGGSCVFIYLIYIYITSYRGINTKLIGWGAQPIRSWNLYHIESVRVRVIIEVREG